MDKNDNDFPTVVLNSLITDTMARVFQWIKLVAALFLLAWALNHAL